MTKKKQMDKCIGRGCGGLIPGLEAEESDGAIHYCSRCKREHMFHTDGIAWHWEIARKQTKRKK